MRKLKSKKGFTLMEMLIVVAIIGILAAIAIPVFSAQLSKAEDAVEEADKRAASSMAVAQYMLDSETSTATYYAVIDAKGNMNLQTADPSGGSLDYVTVTLAAGGAVDTVTYVEK